MRKTSILAQTGRVKANPAICYTHDMSKEGVPLQSEMFTGAWVDNRTASQKRLAHEQTQPRQQTMFPAADLFVMGEQTRPWLNQPDLPRPTLALERVDLRTPEQIELDILREALTQTPSLFPDPQPPTYADDLLFGYPLSAWQTEQVQLTQTTEASAPQPIEIPKSVCYSAKTIGYRARQRQIATGLRQR